MAAVRWESTTANWLHSTWSTTMTSRATSRTQPCQPASRAAIWSPAPAAWLTPATCCCWRPANAQHSLATDWVSVRSGDGRCRRQWQLRNLQIWNFILENYMCRFVVNGMGTPGVMPPFTAIGLGTPSLANAYGSGIPSLGAFALASSGALGSATPGALRGLSNVLLVSNLNEEVMWCSFLSYDCRKFIDNSLSNPHQFSHSRRTQLINQLN